MYLFETPPPSPKKAVTERLLFDLWFALKHYVWNIVTHARLIKCPSSYFKKSGIILCIYQTAPYYSKKSSYSQKRSPQSCQILYLFKTPLSYFKKKRYSILYLFEADPSNFKKSDCYHIPGSFHLLGTVKTPRMSR